MDTILLVEDDRFFREMFSNLLQAEGYQVETASCGNDGLEMLAKGQYSLVITDLEMPELDGLGFLRGLREHPVMRHIPVMVLTAMGDEHYIVRAFELGADDYVLKPFTMREVTARLRRLLRRPTSAGVPLTVD